MQYLMAPLEAHYDDGFGATAEAFERAAEKLAKQKGSKAFFEHFPEGFLLRHAIELFFKSGIIIIHRKLKLPFGSDAYTSEPMLLTGGHWKQVYKTHGVADLYGYWKALITENDVRLRAMCKWKDIADWSIPKDLDGWIQTIENEDPRSTYFRYPVSHDAASDRKKSPFKEIPLEGLFPADLPVEKKVRALIVKNQDNHFVRAYAYDESTNKKVMEALNRAVSILSGFHSMMRIELTGGW